MTLLCNYKIPPLPSLCSVRFTEYSGSTWNKIWSRFVQMTDDQSCCVYIRGAAHAWVFVYAAKKQWISFRCSTQSFTNNSEEAHTCSSTPYCDIGCICAVLGSREVKDGHSTTGCRLGSQSASRAGLEGLWLVAWHPCCHDDGNQVLPVWSVSRRRSTLKQMIQMDRLQNSQPMMRR